jgi:hypothetical protein
MGESITSANKALAIEAITGAFIKRDTTIPGRLCVPDYKQHNPTIPNGSASIPGVIRALPPDFKYEMGLVVAGGGVCHDSRPLYRLGSEASRRGRHFSHRRWEARRTLGCNARRSPC